MNGLRMCEDLLQKAPDGSVTLVALSGMTDIRQLCSGSPELVKQKVGRVVLMSGVEVEGNEAKLSEEGYMTPDKAQNNTFDMEAAEELFRTVQRLGIPMTVVTRWAAYAAKLPLSIYDRMAKTCNPVGVRLQKAQRFSLEHLWKRCCMPDDDPAREGLPGRCDKGWFSKVFLAGKGMDRTGSDSIWDLTGTFQAYDPMAQMCAIEALKKKYFDPCIVHVQGHEKTVV